MLYKKITFIAGENGHRLCVRKWTSMVWEKMDIDGMGENGH